MAQKNTFEVCIDSVESALIAEAGGAHRLELCGNLLEGGTTPSYGTVQQCLAHTQLPIRMMIRPRGGDFLYSEHEFEIMKSDILMAKSLNVQGLVFGLLTQEGRVDIERNRTLLKLADPLPCTFHRAFDRTQVPQQALEDIIALGFDILLSSGLEANVDKGTPLLKKLVDQAGTRIQIMAGAGIHPDNVENLILQSGVQHIHASASHSISSHMQYRNPHLHMGEEGYDEFRRKQTHQEKVAQILAQANKAWKSE